MKILVILPLQNLNKKIIIKPKNVEQDNSRTKVNLLQVIDPLSTNANLQNVKHIKAGDLVEIVNSLEENLSSEYEIHVVESSHLQI